MPAHKKETPLKHCAYCGKKLERKRLPNGDPECLINFKKRKFCNRICMAKDFDARPTRSIGKSPTRYHARKMVPKGSCSICGKKNARDVHHVDGDYTNNTPQNLIRICRTCHSLKHSKRSSCKICGKPQRGLGYCAKHYYRFKKYGDPLIIKRNQFVDACREGEYKRRTCSHPGCDRVHLAKGLCGMHYKREKRASVNKDRLAEPEGD